MWSRCGVSGQRGAEGPVDCRSSIQHRYLQPTSIGGTLGYHENGVEKQQLSPLALRKSTCVAQASCILWQPITSASGSALSQEGT